jgi:hypothetical protein
MTESSEGIPTHVEYPVLHCAVRQQDPATLSATQSKNRKIDRLWRRSDPT